METILLLWILAATTYSGSIMGVLTAMYAANREKTKRLKEDGYQICDSKDKNNFLGNAFSISLPKILIPGLNAICAFDLLLNFEKHYQQNLSKELSAGHIEREPLVCTSYSVSEPILEDLSENWITKNNPHILGEKKYAAQRSFASSRKNGYSIQPSKTISTPQYLYAVEDVAKYIIRFTIEQFSEKGKKEIKPVNCRSLNALLYLLYHDLYQKTGEQLFEPEFVETGYGIIIESIYEQYSIFGTNSILLLKKSDRNINIPAVDEIISKYAGFDYESILKLARLKFTGEQLKSISLEDIEDTISKNSLRKEYI